MTAYPFVRTLAWLLALALAAGCSPTRTREASSAYLQEVAHSERQWTGIAVSPANRIFVNFPRWSDDVPVSVGEVQADGSVTPYPDTRWNLWDQTMLPQKSFVCVQSVMIDNEGFLWILDPANPKFQGVVQGGAKLLKVDLKSDQVIQAISFAPPAITSRSYLNDVRVDTARDVAYITDSGDAALVVVDLATGSSRRLLAGHPSTRSEGIVLTIEGQEWRKPDGGVRDVHADGIALDPRGEYLYYQALTGRHMYRIATAHLRDAALSPQALGEKVELVGETGASDGLLYGPEGRIYISALEDDAVKATTPDGQVTTVVQSPLLAWPDSFALGPDGVIYVTTSQIHRLPDPPEPYRIFRILGRK